MARMYNDGIPRYQGDRGYCSCLRLGCQNGEVVDVDDDLAVMMSCGVLDVDTNMM